VIFFFWRSDNQARMAERIAFMTGGSGFLGLNLVERLVTDGWKVVAMQRSMGKTPFLDRFDIDKFSGDVCDPASIEAAMPLGCDAVFHLAADMTFWPPRHRRQYQVNTVGTRNVVAAALRRRAGCLVHVSSAAAFGLHRERVTEQTVSTGHQARIGYVRTKALAEDEVREGWRRGLRAIIVNPTTLIGRYDTRVWLPVFRAVERGRLAGVAPGRTSYAQAAEVARALVAAAERGVAGASYLVGGPDATFLEVVQRIATLTGGRAPRRATPEPLVRAFARLALAASYVTRREPRLTPEGAEYLIHRNVVSSERAARELGYRPPTLDEALGDYHGWLLGEGLLAARAQRGA
jgi:nucleoside-diphosphate-sugar epimerase